MKIEKAQLLNIKFNKNVFSRSCGVTYGLADGAI
jgi:hypothetical protein